MSALQILFWLLTIIITIAATIWVNKRSTEKKLTAYLDFISPLFTHVSPEVREELDIRYRGMEVTELTQFRFIVTNEGQQALGDYDRPLTLHLSGNPTLLSLEIADQHPDELDAGLRAPEAKDNEEEHQIQFAFPFLNSGDWFVISGLVEGNLPRSDLKFSIREKNLPTEVPIEPSFSYSPPGLRAKVIPWATFLGALGLAFAFWTTPFREWLQTTFGTPSALAIGVKIGVALLVFGVSGGILHALIKKVWPAQHTPPPFTSITGAVDAWRHASDGIAVRDSMPAPEEVYVRRRWPTNE